METLRVSEMAVYLIHTLRMLLNDLTVVEDITVSKKEEVAGILRKSHNERLQDLHCSVDCVVVYIHVTVHRNRFLFKQPTRRTNYPNLFCYKTLHVSGIFSVHHQQFSTVHSALVSLVQVSDDRLEADSGCSIVTVLGSGHQNLHETYQCRMYSRKLLMMGREDTRNM